MEPAHPLGLTVLRCVGDKRATKRFVWNHGLGENGAWVKTSFNAGAVFIPVEHRLANLRSLADLVEGLRSDPRAFIVRGGLSDTALAEVSRATAARRTPRIRRLKRARGDIQPTLIDLPRTWVLVDIDNWRLRGSDDLVDDPESAIDAAIHELLPEAFHNVDYYWQLSASAGFTPGVLKVHVWFLLTEPATNRHLRTVFKQCAPGVDSALFDSIQVHYVADPIIEGRPDPIPRRTGWHDGLEPAVELPALVKQEHQPCGTRAAGAAGGAADVAAALAHLGYGEGGEGFHAPLRAATWGYAIQCDQHSQQRDDQALKDMLWAAIQAAPCHDGRDIHAQYRDGPYLQNLIDGAFRMLASNLQHQSQRPKQLSAAQEIAAATVQLAGTLGEYHLKQHLGIPPRLNAWPDAIRYHPDQRSIIAIAHADDGSVQAVRRLPLKDDGAAAGSAETIGVIAESVVRLPGITDGPLLVATSVQVGLAAWASTQREVWIALGGFNDIPPPSGRLLMLLSDDNPRRYDARHGQPTKRLHKAVRDFRHAGVRVAVATPITPRRHEGLTFADIILQHGTAGVAERIEAAIAPAQATVERWGILDAQAIVQEHVRSVMDEIDAQSALMIQKIKAEKGAKAYVKKSGSHAASPAPAATEPTPFVKATAMDVGVGKSSTSRFEAARVLTNMRARGDKRVAVFAVPDHTLGEQQKTEWLELIEKNRFNLTVEVWRSRKAVDPRHPDFQNSTIPKDAKATMCADIERTIDAESVGLAVQEAVCHRRTKSEDGKFVDVKCPLFDSCSFQAQRAKKADVWIVAHSSIYHAKPEAIGKLAVLFVDEAAWATGLVGVEVGNDDGAETHLQVSLLALGNDDMGALRGADRERLIHLRLQLFKILSRLPDGSLGRDALLNSVDPAITADMAAEAVALEYGRKVKTLHPGQTKEQRRAALEAIHGNKTIARRAMLWDGIRLLLAPDAPNRSGWVELATERQGDTPFRAARLKKRRDIAKGWQVPTQALDATFNVDLARHYWPNVEVLTTVRVATPHQRIFQVIDRAYSQGMLKSLSPEAAKADPEEDQRRRNRLGDLRANIFHLARYYAPGEVLVILQLAVEEALLELGPLPPNVMTAHHNNIVGQDRWRNVRAAVIVGRTQPSPAAVERICEALTGQAVENRIPEGGWYHRVDAVREMADGTSLLDETDRHPDPTCEAVRWQICEAQIVQGIGRSRGVWRTAETPCDVWVLSDVILPLPVDGLVHADWLKPTLDQDMLADGGVVLENSEHAAEVFLGLGKTVKARSDRVREWAAKGGGLSGGRTAQHPGCCLVRPGSVPRRHGVPHGAVCREDRAAGLVPRRG